VDFELPASWRTLLSEEIHKPYFANLAQFVDSERSSHSVYPPPKDVFNAFMLTPYD
jgi:uracil-DNA glycosylase